MSHTTATTSRTSFKAFAFGIAAALALAVGVTHAEAQRERAASIVQLDTVYITGKRVVAQAETLPTVYITGRRAATAEDLQVADAATGCAAQVC